MSKNKEMKPSEFLETLGITFNLYIKPRKLLPKKMLEKLDKNFVSKEENQKLQQEKNDLAKLCEEKEKELEDLKIFIREIIDNCKTFGEEHPNWISKIELKQKLKEE